MITVQNIRKSFNKTTVLHGVNLNIKKGNIVVILGPSGSGKTTFLRCLNALELPEQGSIDFDSENPLHIDFEKKLSNKDILTLRRKCGMVFQQYHLFPHKTIIENIMEGPIFVQNRNIDIVRLEALSLLKK